MTELLAPAGGKEALIAAVQNGANAVYMGFGAFNARRSARNFSDEEFCAAVRYCHLRGVKVYLTLNTLLTDRELPELAETAKRASSYGVDAILVQDWGVLETLRRVIPDVPLHASTQMSIHTRSGAEKAAQLGCTRVVLARELSREDIRAICESSGIEIEVFVHGALCMCYSGQCEMSAVIGGRSGNRGACAQPCRLPYGWRGKADAYPLSLKDNNLSAYVAELADMGVACLKLEGRMKRPEYVAAVTGIYASLLRDGRQPNTAEKKQLNDAFSRSGFTDGYFRGTRGSKMFGTRSENERWPEDWFTALRQAYEKEDMRTVPVRLSADIRADRAMCLTAEDTDGHRVCVSGAIPEAARSRAVTADEVRQRLGKTGGTAFSVVSCEVWLDGQLAVSAGAINALRREALAALETLRTAVPERRSLDYAPLPRIPNRSEPPRFTCSLARPEQLTEALVREHPEMIYLPVEFFAQLSLSPYLGRTHFCAVLPRIYRTADEERLRGMLEQARNAGAEAVAIGNLGHLVLAERLGLKLCGDFGLNLFNSAALDFCRRQGFSTALVSFELRREQIRDLSKPLPCEAIVYGRLPLMVTENCIIANSHGCRYAASRCDGIPADGSCCTEPQLTDRRGERFPVLRVFGCRSEIQNAKTLFLADRGDYADIGLSLARLRFTTESPETCVRVLRSYRGQDDYRPDDLTRGLFYRGVE